MSATADVPGLIVGGQTGQYELYYLFPLTQEQRP